MTNVIKLPYINPVEIRLHDAIFRAIDGVCKEDYITGALVLGVLEVVRAEILQQILTPSPTPID